MSQPTADDLGQVPLLAALDAQNLERLASRLLVAEFAEGERIVIEGTPGLDLFIIHSGRAIADQRERGLVRLLGPGDFFGEIALMGKGQRTATVTSSSPMVVWVLPSDAIRVLQTEYPDVTTALRTAMDDRLTGD